MFKPKVTKISGRIWPKIVLILSASIFAFLSISHSTKHFLRQSRSFDSNNIKLTDLSGATNQGKNRDVSDTISSSSNQNLPSPQSAINFRHVSEFLSLPVGTERLEHLVPFLVKLNAPDPIYVVQVGANTGYELTYKTHSKDDPIVAAVRNPAARGVLVEPVPANFERLSANIRPYSDRFKCINAAVNTGDTTLSKALFFTMRSDRVRREWRGAFPWFLDQLGSFDVNHLKKHFEVVRGDWTPKHPQDYYIERTVVNALPAAAIIGKLYEAFQKTAARERKFKSIGISLLHVDAEGYDWKITGAFLKSTRPRAIVFEHHHMRKRELLSARDLLSSTGYVHWEHGRNTYAIHLRGLV